MGLLTSLDCLFKRSTVLSIIHRLQVIVDSSGSAFAKSYEDCEYLTNAIVHFFKIFIFAAVFTVITVPLLVLVFVSMTEGFSEELLMLPASLL